MELDDLAGPGLTTIIFTFNKKQNSRDHVVEFGRLRIPVQSPPTPVRSEKNDVSVI